MFNYTEKEMKTISKAALIGTVLLVVLASGVFFAVPKYNAWRKVVAAEADLKAAEYTRRVIVEQAKAELEAAQSQADAIGIVGKAAQEFPEYREQEFIRSFASSLERGDVELIFVPTEANVPIIKTK